MITACDHIKSPLYYMNKIGSQRYPSHGELSRSPRSFDSHNIKKINQSHAVTLLTQKQSHIDMLKRRISALCVKEERVSNRTINNDQRWEQKYKIKEESLQIKLLLEKQKKKDAQRLEVLKNRNLQTRVSNYYRAKTFKQTQVQNKRESSNILRTKSRQYDRIISKQKEEEFQEKRSKKDEVNKSEQNVKSERSRVQLQKQKSVQQTQKREVEHLLNLGSIKDTQLSKLGQLELLMVEKNTSSRMAYDASLERLSKIQLRRKSSSNYYRPSEVIRSARESSSRFNQSLHC